VDRRCVEKGGCREEGLLFTLLFESEAFGVAGGGGLEAREESPLALMVGADAAFELPLRVLLAGSGGRSLDT
jgi:hypothetical protein